MLSFSPSDTLPLVSFLMPGGEPTLRNWQFSGVFGASFSPNALPTLRGGHHATLALMYASLDALEGHWDRYRVEPTASLLPGQALQSRKKPLPEDLHVAALIADFHRVRPAAISPLIDGRHRVAHRHRLGLSRTVVYQADQPWLKFTSDQITRTGEGFDLTVMMACMRPHVEEAYERLATWNLTGFPYPTVFLPGLMDGAEWAIRSDRGHLCDLFGWIEEDTQVSSPGGQRVHQVRTADGPVTLYATAPKLDGALAYAARERQGFQLADTAALTLTLQEQNKTPKPEDAVPAITHLHTSAGWQTVVLTGCETIRTRLAQGKRETLVYVQADPRPITFTPEEARVWSSVRRLPHRFVQTAWIRHRKLRSMGRLLYPTPKQTWT
ncbi:hypothetical protein SAMN00790413_03833 [Deinococcus hopiensis KR-140]|uniref:Uncharacterized protein n=1 Tax=Deinococcus hopiensis KR-140 TaxID=695939 RepID=A0A1W1UZK1_9DEIO|nr:hypothetical protein SAMN00790413_03833 [Deinococcus hopiensis KR-140]